MLKQLIMNCSDKINLSKYTWEMLANKTQVLIYESSYCLRLINISWNNLKLI